MATSSINKLQKTLITAAANSGEGHIPSALSILDILWVLYDRILRVDPMQPQSTDRDRFILSKGHASLALYAVLSERGFFRVEELDGFGKIDGILGGHPDRNKVPGVEASTGSLGHGLPMAVGVALGLKIQKNTRNRVFALIGDGEANEGTIWESALLAANHKLNNLCCIVDYNHSTDRALLVGDLAEKFVAFGWGCSEINGHDHEQIFDSLQKNPSINRPQAIIANCIKGHGCKIMENNPAWHHRSPSQDELRTILEELS